MKKLYYILYLLTAVLVSSCLHEEEDLFKESSAKRADALIETHIAALTGASNGWHMEYFPAHSQEYGGYNMLLSFDRDGKVKAAGEISKPDEVATGLYSVKQSAGVLLSLDTQNEIFHLFADPSDPLGVGERGKGAEGDYDFLILEASAEKIVLKGKKTGGTAVMTPVQGEWSSFISTIKEADKTMTFRGFEMKIGELPIQVATSYRTLTFTYEEKGDTKEQVASYVVTKTGYKFYQSIVINGVTLTGFTFDPANKWFTVDGNESIKVIPIPPTVAELFMEKTWYIAHSGFNSKFHWWYFRANFEDKALGDKKLNWTRFAPYEPGSAVFSFDVSGEHGFVTFKWHAVGDADDQVYMELEGKANDAGVAYWKAGFELLAMPFNKKTFIIELDNDSNPTVAVLTNSNSKDTKITLTTQQVLDPLNN